jgi:hypothetical protein
MQVARIEIHNKEISKNAGPTKRSLKNMPDQRAFNKSCNENRTICADAIPTRFHTSHAATAIIK